MFPEAQDSPVEQMQMRSHLACNRFIPSLWDVIILTFRWKIAALYDRQAGSQSLNAFNKPPKGTLESNSQRRYCLNQTMIIFNEWTFLPEDPGEWSFEYILTYFMYHNIAKYINELSCQQGRVLETVSQNKNPMLAHATKYQHTRNYSISVPFQPVNTQQHLTIIVEA